MKRKRRYPNTKADAILCGDVHIRDTKPKCRTDDFEEAQWEKLKFISDLQVEHDCPVLCSGDLFDYWKPSLHLLAKTVERLPKQFYTVYGNHDLPQHNLELVHKSGVHLLDKADVLNVLPGVHWGMKPVKEDIIKVAGKKAIAWHIHTYKKKEPWPGCASPKAIGLLKRYPEFDLILTGDNHLPFVQKYDGRVLVNPGSMTRQTADQIDFKPRVYLYYAKANEVQPIYLPIRKGVVSREHLEEKQNKENRIHAFISSLDGDMKYFNFEKDLLSFIERNPIKKKTKEIILEAIEQ